MNYTTVFLFSLLSLPITASLSFGGGGRMLPATPAISCENTLLMIDSFDIGSKPGVLSPFLGDSYICNNSDEKNDRLPSAPGKQPSTQPSSVYPYAPYSGLIVANNSSVVLNNAVYHTFSDLHRESNTDAMSERQAEKDEPYYTITPRTYCCLKTREKITIDGNMDEAAWQSAAWTEDFVDIQGTAEAEPRYRTRVKMLWDQENLYFFAEITDPHVWGSITKRDAVIFHDNNFEIFICPSGKNHYYYEFEMNALNTVWDLFLLKPYRDGGKADNSWDIAGLRSAVNVRGTLNDASDTDQGWTAEIAIPWSAFDRHGEMAPRFAGKTWRINFSRVQWQHQMKDGRYEKVPDARKDNWAWSPQGVVDMHRPEKWGWVRFVDDNSGCNDFDADPHYPYIMALHRIYWAQKSFFDTNKRWAKDFNELGITAKSLRIDEWLPTLTRTYNGWQAEYSVLADETTTTQTWVLLTIDQDSELSRSIGFDKLLK